MDYFYLIIFVLFGVLFKPFIQFLDFVCAAEKNLLNLPMYVHLLLLLSAMPVSQNLIISRCNKKPCHTLFSDNPLHFDVCHYFSIILTLIKMS